MAGSILRVPDQDEGVSGTQVAQFPWTFCIKNSAPLGAGSGSCLRPSMAPSNEPERAKQRLDVPSQSPLGRQICDVLCGVGMDVELSTSNVFASWLTLARREGAAIGWPPGARPGQAGHSPGAAKRADVKVAAIHPTARFCQQKTRRGARGSGNGDSRVGVGDI